MYSFVVKVSAKGSGNLSLIPGSDVHFMSFFGQMAECGIFKSEPHWSNSVPTEGIFLPLFVGVEVDQC